MQSDVVLAHVCCRCVTVTFWICGTCTHTHTHILYNQYEIYVSPENAASSFNAVRCVRMWSFVSHPSPSKWTRMRCITIYSMYMKMYAHAFRLQDEYAGCWGMKIPRIMRARIRRSVKHICSRLRRNPLAEMVWWVWFVPLLFSFYLEYCIGFAVIINLCTLWRRKKYC